MHGFVGFGMALTQPKTKKCKECRKPFTPFNSMAKVCSPKCALALVNKKNERKFNAETRRLKAKVKTKGQWLKEAQAAFNAYIRIRDKGKKCISCDSEMDWNSYGGKVDAGHYRSTGAAPHLRFNPLNCHAQCVKCNRYLSSNTVEYRIRLVERIGQGMVDSIESNNGELRFDLPMLKRIKKAYTKKSNLYKRMFRNEQVQNIQRR